MHDHLLSIDEKNLQYLENKQASGVSAALQKFMQKKFIVAENEDEITYSQVVELDLGSVVSDFRSSRPQEKNCTDPGERNG